MKIRFERVDQLPFTTVGYWFFEKPNNKGTLHIQILRLKDFRFEWAVLGHELIESLYCWIRGITTEECDRFDTHYEQEYKSGRISRTKEAGDDPQCPYHWGHAAGVCWEYVCIYGTFASWNRYAKNCDEVMGLIIP